VITLEVGILVGVVLFGLGLAGSIYAIVHWEHLSFGRLDYASWMRRIIPATTLLALGSQTILASFFMSILGLKRR
jgi:hypothetical protein